MLWVAAAGKALAIEDYAFAPDGKRLLVFTQSERVWRQNTRGEYYVVTMDGNSEPRRLGGKLPVSTLMFAKWSPDGGRVAYVAQNDIYVEDVGSGAVSAADPGRLAHDDQRHLRLGLRGGVRTAATASVGAPTASRSRSGSSTAAGSASSR